MYLEPTHERYLQFENLRQFPEIQHFVSTRKGGHSLAPYQSLNLGLAGQDSSASVLANRQTLTQSLEIPFESLCFAQQVHGHKVHRLKPQDRGCGREHFQKGIADCDALISDQAGLCPVVMAADCTPILIYDPDKKAVAAIHSGWRGTRQKILLTCLEKMAQEFSSRPSDLWVGIGPCIHKEVYEVGEEVQKDFRTHFGPSSASFFHLGPRGKAHLDLVAANLSLLKAFGVPHSQIEIAPHCTHQNEDLFFSARRDGVDSGRMAAGILLKPH